MLEPAPVIETSPWNAGLITALFGGMALIVASIGKVLVDLRTAKNKAVEAAGLAVIAVKAADEVKHNVEKSRREGEAAGNARDAKLNEIKMLVDGKFSLVLDKVALLTRQRADSSGLPSDIADAEEAEDQAAKQREKVLAAGVVVEGVLTVTPAEPKGTE